MKKIIVALLFAPTLALAQDQGEANKKLVLDFFRVVFQAENAAAAKDYLADDYVQHNPLVETGRAGFEKYFGAKWRAPKPVEPVLHDAPSEIVAQGDLVFMMWKVARPEPSDKSKTYESFWFDAFRVKGGKLVEHWDNALKK